MARLLTFLNSASLVISLTLVALSTTIFYFTSHGMNLMDSAFPPGKYEWYRGPHYDPGTKHKITLRYDSANEGIILAAGAVSVLAGIGGVVGFFLTRKTIVSAPQRSTLSLILLPGGAAFIATLIAIVITSIIFTTDHRGSCYWENGYIPNNTLTCTRELAACNIGSFLVSVPWWTLQRACGETQTGRHLVAPLFVAGVLLFGLGIARVVVAKRSQNEYLESADERVARLQREEQ
ncbi:hypothetical protein BKA66DRAFT_566188 [Pyrenochaeta sp. MPI-SDFR-AT-0127]|nr:hypothetical protein BKA66DRAFT_566188 [Pyrenochaeta sp. MPI-SDFR-AT-0127]